MPKKIKIKAGLFYGLIILILIIFMTIGVSAADSAEYLGNDETVRGDWVGKYGSDGNVVIGFKDMFPKTVNNFFVNVSGEIGYYEWWSTGYNPQNYSEADISRREPGALLLYSQKTTRVAGCYYAAQALMLDIDVGDKTETVSLYMLDYDEQGRIAEVYVYDEEGNELVKPVNVDTYDKGVYLKYKISGAVSFMIENVPLPEINVCLSGIFFDPAPADDINSALNINGNNNQTGTDSNPKNAKNNDVFAAITAILLIIIISTPIIIVKNDMKKTKENEENKKNERIGENV